MDNQVLFTIITLALISILFLIAYINSKKIPERKREKILSKLEEIESQSKSVEGYARRDAVIKLDNLLSKAFNIRYGNDITIGENLKKAKGLYDKTLYQQIWDVHKIRNEVVHKDREISLPESEDIYRIYKLGIRHALK